MREILFRGKCPKWGHWHYGELMNTGGKISPFIPMILEIDDSGRIEAYDVDPETVGQFTGLTDKSGKRIFEGDIVVAELSNGNYRGFSWGKQKVVFSQGAFCLENNRAEQTPIRSYAPTVAFEVVGNIHDNLEDT